MNKLTIAIVVLSGMSVVTASAKWARMDGDEVAEVFSGKPTFHKDIMASIVECPDNVEQKWRKSGDTWLPPKSDQERQRDAFNIMRRSLLSMQGVEARKLMADRLAYRLTGPLVSGYPDPTQPMCTNATGRALTVSQFADYVQDCEDAGMQQQDLNKLKADAKAARMYLKSLKGD